MKLKWIFGLILMLSLTGCASMVQNAVDAADAHVRLKWSEEWKPALKDELFSSLSEVQRTALEKTLDTIEEKEMDLEKRLAEFDVRLEDYDKDKDGYVTSTEVATMVSDLSSKGVEWIDILLAVILGYGGTTAGKEFLKHKLRGTGDGRVTT